MSDKIATLINKMVEKLKESYQPEKIILFGSHAYGKPTDDSDVDFLIIKDDSKRTIDRSVEVRRILREENRKIAITSLVYTPSEIENRLSMGDDFVEEVLSKGKVLYAR